MKSYWIWNYGDYELFHSNLVNCRRQQYEADVPPFWKLYDVERNVNFFFEKEIEKDGYMKLYLNGKGCIMVDEIRCPSEEKIKITKGYHTFKISAFNFSGLPSAYIESDVLTTDENWYTKNSDGKKIPVGFEKVYDSPTSDVEKFNFSYEKIQYVSRTNTEKGVLFDFGKEIFGFLYIRNVNENAKLCVSYGESPEEALDTVWSVIREHVSGSESYKLRQRAFRYIYIEGDFNAEVYAELEYLPLEVLGSFECNDKTINDIWSMCAYTMKLCAREVYIEGAKRDRWLWGGDAYQIFKFSKYLYFDKEIVRRSLIGLRGKEPFDQHINTITDYSLYWVISLWEYYMTYEDDEFIKFIYPKAVSLMSFCKDRTNEYGFIIAKGEDWLFIDWSEIDKSGVVCAEQMLYYAALNCMYNLSLIVKEENENYKTQAKELKKQINEFFWNEECGAFIDNYESEHINVTRHANIFAVMYGIADQKQINSISENVLKNDSITKITTPYFEGYELDAMGQIENCEYIYDMICSYWKGMLDLGATTVYEEYDPKLSGIEHYAMYGDKFQKSLCHAWGASPIYLLGKYFLGVSETEAGYKSFTVKPYLGKFEFVKGTVPIKDGKVEVFLSKEKLSVKTDKNGGTLIWNGNKYSLSSNEEFVLKLTD